MASTSLQSSLLLIMPILPALWVTTSKPETPKLCIHPLPLSSITNPDYQVAASSSTLLKKKKKKNLLLKTINLILSPLRHYSILSEVIFFPHFLCAISQKSCQFHFYIPNIFDLSKLLMVSFWLQPLSSLIFYTLLFWPEKFLKSKTDPQHCKNKTSTGPSNTDYDNSHFRNPGTAPIVETHL
jgi:hypothetical protein